MPQMTEEYFVYNQNDVQPEIEISQHYEDVGNPPDDPVSVTTKEKGNFNSDIQRLGKRGRDRQAQGDRNRYAQRDMPGDGWGDKKIEGERRDKRRHSKPWKIQPHRECERERD